GWDPLGGHVLAATSRPACAEESRHAVLMTFCGRAGQLEDHSSRHRSIQHLQRACVEVACSQLDPDDDELRHLRCAGQSCERGGEGEQPAHVLHIVRQSLAHCRRSRRSGGERPLRDDPVDACRDGPADQRLAGNGGASIAHRAPRPPCTGSTTATNAVSSKSSSPPRLGVGCAVGPAVKRLPIRSSSSRCAMESIAAVRSCEYPSISAPSAVASLKGSKASGSGSSYRRHAERSRSSSLLTSVCAVTTFPCSSR